MLICVQAERSRELSKRLLKPFWRHLQKKALQRLQSDYDRPR